MAKGQEVAVADDNKEVANIDALIEADALALSAGLGDITDKISTQNKSYKLPDGTVLGPVMEAVILGFVDSSSYYESEQFDANNIQEPICFADAKGEQVKAPAKSVDKPFAPTCAECDYSQFKSAANGKGKRCKEEYRVALIPEGQEESMVLGIPPTARKAFAKTIGSLTSKFGHPIKALVTFEFNPAVQFSQPVITGAEPNPKYKDQFALVQDSLATLIRS